MSDIKNILTNLFQKIICRPSLLHFNLHMYKLSLRGLGILNSGDPKQTGELWLLNKIKQAGLTKAMIDVGANDGGYSMLLRSIFVNARIISCEPHPQTFKLLSKNSSNLTVLNIGLGSKASQSQLWDFHPDSLLKATQPTSTLASTLPEVITDLYNQKAISYPIRITTLDLLTKKLKIKKIDFLKIDTEGSEYEVLLGAKMLINNHRISVIHFEFNEMNVYSRTYLHDFITLLAGYRLFRLSGNGLIDLSDYRPVTHEIFAYQNIVAIDNRFLAAFLE